MILRDLMLRIRALVAPGRVGVVDDLIRDVLYAFRTFRRAPLAALTMVATVSLGLGLVTAVFAFYSVFMLRVDAVDRPGELFHNLARSTAGAT